MERTKTETVRPRWRRYRTRRNARGEKFSPTSSLFRSSLIVGLFALRAERTEPNTFELGAWPRRASPRGGSLSVDKQKNSPTRVSTYLKNGRALYATPHAKGVSTWATACVASRCFGSVAPAPETCGATNLGKTCGQALYAITPRDLEWAPKLGQRLAPAHPGETKQSRAGSRFSPSRMGFEPIPKADPLALLSLTANKCAARVLVLAVPGHVWRELWESSSAALESGALLYVVDWMGP